MSPEPIFGPKICFFLRYTHITTFIWAQGVRLNRNISPTYPEVTLDTFGFPVGGRLAARWPVFRSQQPKVTFSRPKCENGQKSLFFKLSSKKSPVLGKTMFRVLLPLFASFFVHFQKLIRPHPGPLWGGGSKGIDKLHICKLRKDLRIPGALTFPARKSQCPGKFLSAPPIFSLLLGPLGICLGHKDNIRKFRALKKLAPKVQQLWRYGQVQQRLQKPTLCTPLHLSLNTLEEIIT